MNLRSARVSGSEAGPWPRVVDAAEMAPAPREVAVQVDAVRVAARPGGAAVGVGAVDEQQLDAGRRRRAERSASGHGDPGALVAVDRADDEHLARARRPAPTRCTTMRPALDRVADRVRRAGAARSSALDAMARQAAASAARVAHAGARRSPPAGAGAREEEALDQGDAQALEQGALLGALDALGDDVQVQRPRHEHHGLDDRAVGAGRSAAGRRSARSILMPSTGKSRR